MSGAGVGAERDHTIAAVSKLTGISCHALRAWERRYGFPVPQRSPSGHRRYSHEQVELLRRVAALLHQGETIGPLMAELRAGDLPPPVTPCIEVGPTGLVADLVDRLLDADLSMAEPLFSRLTLGRTPAEVVAQVIEPVLIDVGERWFSGRCAVAQERSATGYLFRKLHCLIEAAQRANTAPARLALVGTVQGERHEGGALIFGLMLELAGWRAVILGSDLPVREYQAATQRWQPDAIGLSFVLSRNVNKRFDELSRLRGAPIFVGGRSILNYQRLARRHGLIPLLGPASSAITQFLETMSSRRQERLRSG